MEHPTQPLPNIAGIVQGIEHAEALNMPVDDYTAREIALTLSTSEDSATQLFAATGVLDHERLVDELHQEGTKKDLDSFQQQLIQHLGTYAVDKYNILKADDI